jgi:aconitate hydratase 2 / 2-methylisocitrate dehydratase
MKNMIADGYADARTLARRIEKVEAWLANPSCWKPTKTPSTRHVIEIDLADIKEPILCCPNDPDDAKFLSEVAGTKIDEAFIGSCMTNIGHFRAAAKLLGGQRDIPGEAVGGTAHQNGRERAHQGRPLRRLRHGRCAHRNARLLAVHGQPGAGARRRDRGVHQTRNFPNRLGKNTNVFLASVPSWQPLRPSWASMPTVAEYHEAMGIVNKDRGHL